MVNDNLEKVCSESESLTPKILTLEWVLKDVNEKLARWRKSISTMGNWQSLWDFEN